MNYQRLFDYMSKRHGLTLLESEKLEILQIVFETEFHAGDTIEWLFNQGISEKIIIDTPIPTIRGELEGIIFLPELLEKYLRFQLHYNLDSNIPTYHFMDWVNGKHVDEMIKAKSREEAIEQMKVKYPNHDFFYVRELY